MSTAAKIVERSLTWLGLKTPTMPVAPEVTNEQFQNLINFLYSLEAEGICIPDLVIPTEIDDDLSEPPWATVGIETNLAIYSAALFQKGELTSRLEKRPRAVIQSITSLVSLSFLIMIVWRTLLFALSMQKVGETTMTVAIPIVPFAYILAVSCALLALVLLSDFFNALSEIWR